VQKWPSRDCAVDFAGGIAEGVGGSPDHEHIQRLVSTLGDLDVPDVEPEHANETPGITTNAWSPLS
jgi:hypothetical protein